MIKPQLVDRPKRGCVHVAGEIHAQDLGAEDNGYRNYSPSGMPSSQ
jgi:hypothetical protein